MANLNFKKLSEKIGDLLNEISSLETNLKVKEELVLQKEKNIRENEETIQQLKRDLLYQQSANEKLREEKIRCEEELGELKAKIAKKKVKAD
jgi:chromosome segregation ATPase